MKRLWRFKGLGLNDLSSEEIIANYVPYRLFVWIEYGYYGDAPKSDNGNTDAENMVLNGMDAGPAGERCSYEIFPAAFSEVTLEDCELWDLLSHKDAVGTDNDKFWPPCVYMYREMISVYDGWKRNQDAHGSLFAEEMAA